MSPSSIFITGCNRGIGLELVKQFLKQKPQHIFATTRTLDAQGELNALSKENKNLHILQFDVTKLDSLPQIVNQVGAAVGENGLNLLINNAGFSPKPNHLNVVTPEDMMNAFEVNCVAPLFISRGFLPLLQKAADNAHKKDMGADRAAIIQMSTIMASFQDDPSGGNAYAYRCSKTALNMAMKNLAVDLSKTGILTISLHPGWVKTDMGGQYAPISVEESCAAILETVDNLTEKDHGAFLRYDSAPMQW
jgi:NAD(P)-dependent dehydrogenase (short-subunit alcohol dehydrogenase family)